MASLHPSRAMPCDITPQLHQQLQVSQSGRSMPQSNGISARPPAYMPVNTQPYHHPPLPPADLHGSPDIQISQSRIPQRYRALRLEKASSGSSWEKTTVSEKPMSQSMIRDRIDWLQKNTISVTKKKQEKNEAIQSQIDKVQADLTREDHDVRFYYKLAQLESEWRAADDRRRGDDRSEQSSRRHRSHSKRNKIPKLERVAVVAYFVSTPAADRHGSRPHGTNMLPKQPKQAQYSQAPQKNAEGLPPVTLVSTFPRSVPSNAHGLAPPMTDSRPKHQPKPIITQQATVPQALKVPQAQPPYQDALNMPKQGGMASASHNVVMLQTVKPAGPAPAQVSVGQPPKLPPIQLPLRPPQVPRPLSVPKAPPAMPPAGPGALKGVSDAGRQPSAPKIAIVESKPNVRDNIKIYHVSDQSSSSSDNGWSEDESEGTTPSSISSDHSLRQRGRGRSPKRTHADHHRNVIIQDSRQYDERDKPTQRQRVRFNSPDYLYRGESRAPREKHHSRSRADEPWRAKPPRIIQVPRHSVRHVPGLATRRDTSNNRYSIGERPPEHARLNDSHHEHDIRRDNDRFKHLQEDAWRRQDFRERRDDGREDGDEYEGSDSRWTEQQARDYMHQREPRRSYRYHG
ncbi:hypothetical protein FVEN_g7886 [Fusarium venenatum]|uniref:Uncharacterized protein n=1 Tax=Fusarium venenatum TaxID=56646 RepID=A0A2L2TEV1_9HYPO|nr:uncharacterized protein FVRRES_08695 [Fusarium venenatum]KAG8354114.1 hypothetical protein FVEN_g7886 [Fusarium venenatum]KAH6965447.1 hypothetical protein EDB82DRAFT_529172 [Fusarium venenatum]CEI68618.1 unnamed protein product [Fusarium venenatum]